MFNKLVADILTSYLGEYFEIIDHEQVRVSIWNGLVHMRNLKVRKDALRYLDAPVCVLMGIVEELTIVIPWMRLRSEAVVVRIRKAKCILADKETAGYGIEQDVREARAHKIRELAAIDKALLSAFREGLSRQGLSAAASASAAAPSSGKADSSDDNLTARLKASILNNIRIEVEELLVHYTSCTASASPTDHGVLPGELGSKASTMQSQQQQWQHSMDSAPLKGAHLDAGVHPADKQASLSFQIKEIKTYGCNERFEPAFIAPGERVGRQLISFRGLSASLQTGASSGSDLPLLKPLDVVMEMAYQPVCVSVSTPQYMVAVRVNGACSCVITSESCTTCYGLVQHLIEVRQRQALRRLRPVQERPKDNPHAWWRYTLDAVQQQVRNCKSAALVSAHKPTPFSWLAYNRVQQKRDLYMRLYLRQQRTALGATEWLEPLTADEEVKIAALENELTIDVLTLGKRLAVARVGLERVEYEKLLRQKKMVTTANETSDSSPVHPSAPPTAHLAPAAKSRWFSWSWESKPTASTNVTVTGDAADDLSDETRTELRELVQLMTAERWSDAQRVVIAKEFGIGPEEANALAQHDASSPASTQDSAAVDPSKKGTSGRTVPSCVVSLHAAALTVELQGSLLSAPSTLSTAMHETEASTPAPSAFAQVVLHALHAGVEWRGFSPAGASALPMAYYWGTLEGLSVTAAASMTEDHQPRMNSSTERTILSICRPGGQDGLQSDSVSRQSTPNTCSHYTSLSNATERPASVCRSVPRTFSPLESCWSVLPNECRRRAAVRVEWTKRSIEQLTSRSSALHSVHVGLAHIHLSMDVVPLHHLSEFFFTVMWPKSALRTSAAGDSAGNVQVSSSPPVDSSMDSDFTALQIPLLRRMTHFEQRCATDASVRLASLRSRVEHQRSIDWAVRVDNLHVSISEVPQVQGCELTLTQVCVQNDVKHQLQRHERLCGEGDRDHQPSTTSRPVTITTTAALGSLDTDWVDRTCIQIAAVCLSVFFPTSPTASVASRDIKKCVILPETTLTAVVERSLLGRGHPDLPQWNLQISSSDSVSLKWSRTSLSVLTTACSLLRDLAESFMFRIEQRGVAQSSRVHSLEREAVSTFHVSVLPHPTGKKFWHAAPGKQSNLGDAHDDDPPRATDKWEPHETDPHQLSGTGQHAAGMVGASLPQRIDVRRGVCVVYHAKLSAFPAQYYTLQTGCTRVYRDGGTKGVEAPGAASVTAGGPLVHLYVSQGGRSHEEALGGGYTDAKQLLVDTLKVPPALFKNAVWLKGAVDAWLENRKAEESHKSAPSRQQVREALRQVLMGMQAVPCRYVAFHCASDAEADAVEAALRRCCVGATTPPLVFRPSVQRRYDAAVSAPEFCKQPLYRMSLSFPSLDMTCEGNEPALCSNFMKVTDDEADSRLSPRRDAVLSFTPFVCRHDRYPQKRSYELTVKDKVSLCACIGGGVGWDSCLELLEVSAPRNSSAVGPRIHTTGDSSAFSVHFVDHKRPLPLPSAFHCSLRVGQTARMQLQVGPSLLEWGEAWWDTVGLLTNRLFAAEIIVGYPWWRSRESGEKTQEEERGADADVYSNIVIDVERRWCEAREFGGNELRAHVEVIAPALEVKVDRQGDVETTGPITDMPVLRFRARGAACQWRMTEACHHVSVTTETPQLQWCCSPATRSLPSKANWVTLMQSEDVPPTSEAGLGRAKLAVDWKLRRPPPMLSHSDWLCARGGGGGGEGANGKGATGIRDVQELKVELCCVRLLYWHPLLVHLIQLIQEGLAPRASAMVEREPCRFFAGTLFCPPLLWCVPEKSTATVSWTHVSKAVVLQSVELHLPREVDWIALAATSAALPPTAHLRLSVAHCLFTDRVQASASPTSNSSPPTAAANLLFATHFTDMVISHVQPNSGTPFKWRLPSLNVNVAEPVFDARYLWKADMPWHKSCVVELPSVTEPCVMQCCTADLAHAMDLLHASFLQSSPLRTEKPFPSMHVLPPASLLEAIVEKSTATLIVKGELTLCVCSSQSDSSHRSSLSKSCVLRLSGASASVMRSTSGELSYYFAANRVWLGCSAPGSVPPSWSEKGGLSLVQVAPRPRDSASTATITLRCGWCGLVNPVPGSSSTVHTVTPSEKSTLLVDSPGAVTLTLNGEALTILREIIVDDLHLRKSLLRYVAQETQSPPSTSAPTPCHDTSSGGHSQRWAPQEVRVSLENVQCCIPCTAESIHPARSATATPSSPLPMLNCAASNVQVEWRKMLNASHATVRIARLLYCVLEDLCDGDGDGDGGRGGSFSEVTPLVLEQPTEWQVRLTPFTPPLRQASPMFMGAPNPPNISLLDELFGEMPAEVGIGETATGVPTVKRDCTLLTTSTTSQESELLFVALDVSPLQLKVIVELRPLWLVAPSMVRMASILSGIRAQVDLCSAALLGQSGAPVSFDTTTVTMPDLPRSYALQLRSGSISLFVGGKGVTASAMPDISTRSLEAAVRQAIDAQEMVLLLTEAVAVDWHSDPPDSQFFGDPQTVLHIRDISICALQGTQSCTVLLERFSLRVQRLLLGSGVEEWRLSLDALHLTLKQLHYAALLRVALQQTFFLAAMLKLRSSALQSIAAAATAVNLFATAEPPQPYTAMQTIPPAQVRRFHFHLASLRVRVQADGGDREPGPPTAVYFELQNLDVAYYTGQHAQCCVSGPGDDLNERGTSLRLAVTLSSCLLGTENNIPTLAITAASSKDAKKAAQTPCSLRVAQEEATGIYTGSLQVGKVTLTMEAVPMMTWVDLLYTPYLQETVPDYQTAKEHVMQQDLWLSEDLNLSERTPLRVTNQLYSLLYLYGNGHTIHISAARGRQLIFLDEGVTLRIMHATLSMEGSSIEEYVAAGNGSYVSIDPKTCSRVQSSSVTGQTLGISRAEVPGVNHQMRRASEETTKATREMASLRWQRLLGEVEVEMRIPSPRSISGAASVLYDSPHNAATASPQRTLVLYGHMNLCVMSSRSSATGEDDLTAAFDLVHAGVRSEYVTPNSYAAVDATDLVSDWAMKVLMTDEKQPPADCATASPVRARIIHVSASTGVEVRLRYSDAVFVGRSVRHVQATAARWQNAVRRDVQLGLSSLRHVWNATGADEASVNTLLRTGRYGSDGNASVLTASPTADGTVVTVSLKIPYVSIVIIDDSQDTDSPLFRLHANEIVTPQYTLDPVHTSAELRLAVQLEYYDMFRSQWAPVIDPVAVNVSVASHRNTSAADVYDRKGYMRLSARAGTAKLCLSTDVVQNVRQLLVLRDKFESTGVDAPARRGASDYGAATASSSHTFKIVQLTGIDVLVELPEYVESVQGTHQDERVLHTGQEWGFDLPRYHGKELPREYQKIIVQQQQQQVRPSSVQTSRPCHAVIPLSSVGIWRVSLGTCGPLQRYILADVSATPQHHGQKTILLHTLVTFKNRLSMTLLQVALNESGTYDTIGAIPPKSSQYIPVQALRRRVTLALEEGMSGVSVSNLAPSRVPQSKDTIVSLGLSYDSLPCLAGTVFLGVCRCVCDGRRPVRGGGDKRSDVRIAVGKNFEVHSGNQDTRYFLLRVQAAPRQPADVLLYPPLSPLRAVVVTAEAIVTIRNAVGVPLTVALLTRRIQSGTRSTLFDNSPDRTLYTQLCSVVVGVDESYGVTQVDPLEDLCLSVSLQQSNGNVLEQWSAAQAVGVATAHQPPACIYAPCDETCRDAQLALVDLTTNATLLLSIKYKHREVTLYCPQWIINETSVPLQLGDSGSMSHNNVKRSVAPIAGLSGRTVYTATVAPRGSSTSSDVPQLVAGNEQPFLYHSLRAEWRKNSKRFADGEGLFVRLWESAEVGGGGEPAGWTEWSSMPLLVHEAAEAQVISCVSRRMRGKVWMLSCRVEMGLQASIGAYSDTFVVTICPYWVLTNKSPYALRFAQHSGSADNGSPAPVLQVAPFTATALSTVLAPERSDGRLHPLLYFAMCGDRTQSIDQCCWSPPFAINTVGERYVNLVYQALVSLAEHWPESSTGTGQPASQGMADHLPPLRPEDLQEVNGELFVKREEAKVFRITTYKYKGCMMCVQVEEAVQPPLLLENRTSFTVSFRQRGARRVTTVFPRRRKAWTWDAPPAAGQLSAEVELWVLPAAAGDPLQKGQKAHLATCVLNLDPQLIGSQSTAGESFQRELEVDNAETGTSSLLFVRVRGVNGISYAVSLTMEPTIDAYRRLPFRQLSFSLHLASMYILCRAAGERGRRPQDLLLLAIKPVELSFVQGARALNDRSEAAAAAGPREDVDGGDGQRIALRFRTLQVDDERPSAKERVVAQLIDDKDSGFQIERKLLRSTPVLHCSVVAVHLTPVELHIEDSFITALMRYKEEVESHWGALWSSKYSACERRHTAAQGRQALLLPWQVHLERELAVAKQLFTEAQGSCGTMSRQRPTSTVPLWSRVIAIHRLVVDPLLVSLSLYRSPGAAEDPIWKLAGAVSLLVRSTQDARLQWDAIQRCHVCDTIWHLAFLLRESYLQQGKKQYMSLVNVLGINAVRSFVSDLLNPNSGDSTDRRGGHSNAHKAVRRQKQRVPCRQTANLRFGQSAGGTTTSLWRTGSTSACSDPSLEDTQTAAETPTATVSVLKRVQNRAVRLGSRTTVTVAEVARGYAWSDFMAVAQTQEIRAFGGCALARALAEMRTTPRYSLQITNRGEQRPRASEVVRATFDHPGRCSGTGVPPPQVACNRCVELEALRRARLLSREPTPLPHPVRDGFLTWEEFAHHINWYEFVDMCTDDEVRTYASLVHRGASEPSCNVCILTAI